MIKNEVEIDVDDLFTKALDIKEIEVSPDYLCDEFHCSFYDKYLVPLYLEKNESSFVGNGVIVGSYLITAAHVAPSHNKKERCPSLYYKYENEFKKVKNDYVFYDGRNTEVEVGVSNDLIIFNLDDIIGEFVCNDVPIKKGTRLYVSPYTYFEDENKTKSKQNICVVTSIGALSFDKATIWKNCYRVYNSEGFRPGNSGCALFRKNVLYGILIVGGDIECDVRNYTILDANYINQIITNERIVHY